jgi:NAD(P)-dependent dehydrogenase (short-subunit alcohol dehydrogenase family)
VALGSITTERYERFISQQEPAAVAQIEQQIRRLHPIGRIGRPEDVAGAVAYLLSQEAGFITGVTLPVDGGRSILGLDPEARQVSS